MKLAWLETLEAVARHGSFTRAAETLHLTQPAVSLHVRELESVLGRPLLERVGKRVSATTAGEILMQHASRAFAELEAAEQALAALDGVVAGRVRLGTGATASIHLLPPVFRELRDAFPRLDLRVSTGNTPDVVRDLMQGHLDIALVTEPAPDGLVVLGSYVDPLVATVPDGHPLLARRHLTPADIGNEALILYPAGSGIRVVIDDWLRRGAPRADSVMEIGSAEAIKKLVGAGLGVSLLSEHSVRDEVGRGEFHTRALRPALSRRLVLVRRRDKPGAPALDAVEHAIQAHLRVLLPARDARRQ
jgi:DNA-binding transcriptional LysR family regulator